MSFKPELFSDSGKALPLATDGEIFILERGAIVFQCNVSGFLAFIYACSVPFPWIVYVAPNTKELDGSTVQPIGWSFVPTKDQHNMTDSLKLM